MGKLLASWLGVLVNHNWAIIHCMADVVSKDGNTKTRAFVSFEALQQIINHHPVCHRRLIAISTNSKGIGVSRLQIANQVDHTLGSPGT